METCRSRWRGVLLLLLLLLVALIDCVRATASQTSLLSCASAEVEPNTNVVCTIRVRDTQQEPTMSFSVSDFSVVVTGTNSVARVTVSSIERGTDITTAVFSVAATHGTMLTVKVYFTATAGTEAYNPSGEVRNSGLTLLVLAQPATTFGRLACTDVNASQGLVLRESTECTVDVFDSLGSAAVVTASDVTFLEVNRLGSFSFISGKRSLVFTFQAPDDVSIHTTQFTLQVRFKSIYSTVMTSITFPLRYPTLPPSASYSAIHCDDDVRPVLCTVYAADAVGPVQFAADAFTVDIERWRGDGDVRIDTINDIYYIGNDSRAAGGVSSDDAEWYSNLGEFVVDVTANASALVPATRRADVGLLTFMKANNERIQVQRLRVRTRDEAGGDVAASPFYFHSGKVPIAAAATLRGCNTTVIRSTNATYCYIDLLSGISGDARYFTIQSSLSAAISDVTYVAYDAVCRCRTLRFRYVAPLVSARADDYLAVTVWHDRAVVNSPLRMNVLRTGPSSSSSITTSRADAAIVAVGLLFFGSIVATGMVLVVGRHRTRSRIRSGRAAKVREYERASSAAVQRQLAASATAASAGADAGPIASGNSASRRSDAPVSPGLPSASAKSGFVSNAAVEQERFHSDSD
ncbi:hypothetical protein STCU_06404 [Strigomonas culicis]|uniref:Membrane-associated protein n=1 Tax=Strigomonas culicis TaxID=28005 RepID=S9UAF2_9TRYP|nr:hypothetical protein STCU_06404 [Strigomonas culicis]|eukprot:EPY25933.1 hypothetical protein STCU_06404 [Strigomonas culicis]